MMKIKKISIQELDMDKCDLISMFQEIRLINSDNNSINSEIISEIEKIFEDYNIM